MAAAALAPCITRSSSAMILITLHKRVLANAKTLEIPQFRKLWVWNPSHHLLTYLGQTTYRLMNTRLWFLHCISNGDTAVLHQVIHIYLTWGRGWLHVDSTPDVTVLGFQRTAQGSKNPGKHKKYCTHYFLVIHQRLWLPLFGNLFHKKLWAND